MEEIEGIIREAMIASFFLGFLAGAFVVHFINKIKKEVE